MSSPVSNEITVNLVETYLKGSPIGGLMNDAIGGAIIDCRSEKLLMPAVKKL